MATTTDIDPARRNKKPRLLQDGERARLEEYIDSIGYSARYIQSLQGFYVLTDAWQILRQRIRIPTCAAAESDAQSHSTGLLRSFERHPEATVGGRMASPRHNSELRLGAL